MFEKDQLSVLDWFLYFLLMMVPVINIIFFIIILVNRDTNPTLKNYMICNIVLVVVVIVLMIAMGAALGALLQGIFDNLPTETFIPSILKLKLF